MTRTSERFTLVADGIVSGGSVAAGGWVTVEGGLVRATGTAQPPADGGRVERVAGVLAPGFVDIHTHGALGHDFASCTADEARAAVAHHRRHGSTTVIASVATAPVPVLVERVALLGGLVADGTIAGIHLEGPYLSAGHRGAHAADLLRLPAVDELREILAAHPGAVRMVTLAPELPGAEEATRFLVDHGVTVAVGHTSCTGEQARAAFEWGASVLTHAYNGMPSLHHREPGPLGVAMTDQSVTLELILDGHHVCPEAAMVLRGVAPGRLALVSDAMAATGLGDGDYTIAGSAVTVINGTARAISNGSLAGSTITVAEAVARAVDGLGTDLAAAVAMATTIPAAALGLPGHRIVPGATANIVILNGAKVGRVMAAGRPVL